MKTRRVFNCILAVVIIVVAVACASSCSQNMNIGKKPLVVTTLFPQYDFIRTIAGDKVDVKLLLKPGSDSHSYEPTGADMIEIAKASLFVYTGDEMENWAKTILDSVKSDSLKVVDVSENIEIAMVEDIHNKEHKIHSHDGNVYDPHIWTSPLNAIKIVENLLKALISIDGENEEFYKKNAEVLIRELNELDGDFEEFFNSLEKKKLVFGGKFSMHYFAERYGLVCDAAYDTCSTEGEASPGKIAELIEEIKTENLGAVFYAELESPSVAQTIANETNTEALLLHSCHNVTKDEFERGETYISLMRQNFENLKKGMK